jgi:glucosamine kinase
MWIIGIDGGGTKCDAGLFNPAGQLVATAFSGPANIFANFNAAIGEIEQACEQVIDLYNAQEQAKANDILSKKDCFLSLGCAGGGVDSAKKKFQRWQHQYAGAALITDVHASCLAANNANPCALFVIGTGSCLAIFQNQKIQQFGGHGFLLGDNASGAWLGKQAVSWYLQALETPNNDNQLQNALALSIGDNISDIIEHYGKASAAKFGALVPILLRVNDASPTVQTWLHEGAQYASELIIQHAQQSLPVFLSGGLAGIYKPLIEKMTNRPIQIPNNNAVFGAFLAGKQNLLTTKLL